MAEYGLPANNALSAYLGVRDANNRQTALNANTAAQQIGILGMLQQQALQRQRLAEDERVRSAMATGDVNEIAKINPQAASALLQLREQQRQQQFFSPENRARFSTPGRPEYALPDDVAGPVQAAEPATFNLPAFAQEGVMQGVKGAEPLLNHLTQRDAQRQQLAQNFQLAQQRLQRDYDLAAQRGADQRELAQMRIDGQRELRQLMAALRSLSSSVNAKPPSGYRWSNDGNLEPIPGGPADTKVQGQFNSDTAILQSSQQNYDRLRAATEELLGHPGLNKATGLMAAVPLVGGAATIPGTDAANFKAQLETLKSQIGFNVLQDMRAASKTGGALGQITERELTYLQNNLAALDRAQSSSAYRSALKKIIDFTDAAKSRLMAAYNMKYTNNKQVTPEPAATPTAQPSSILDQADAIIRGTK